MTVDIVRGVTHALAPGSRRWIGRGVLAAALFGLSALRASKSADARKKSKRGKGKKKKKKCRGGCRRGSTCPNGQCGCPATAREVTECLPGEDPQWCVPAAGNPKVCCPEHRIYAVCPIEAISATGCTAPEAQSPDVCCAEARLCGGRCCEGPFQCVDASTSTCTGAPPIYARVRRRR
jgi:hypothetical protein